MSEKTIKEIFFSEAREILSNLESDLVLLEEGGDAELLNRIFRYAHTLKGSSAIVGFDKVAEFTHGLESVLDRLRSGGLAIDDRLTDLLLNSFDWVKLELFGGAGSSESGAVKQRLMGLMREYTDAEIGQEEAPSQRQDRPGAGCRYFRALVRFKQKIFERGIDPLALMEDFVAQGRIIKLIVDDSELPGIHELDPEQCYLGWDITLKTSRTKEELEAAFMFVMDDNEVILEDVSSRYAEGEGSEEKILEDKKIGDILVEKGILTKAELEDVIKIQSVNNRRIGDIIVERGYASEQEVTAALNEQDRIRTRIASGTVRVDAKKLDDLLNLLGEIVIGQSAIARIADNLPEEQGVSLKNAYYNIERATRVFQEQIMSIRMIPIGPTFNQFRRFVRDMARELGKEIKFEIFGEETELDKTVIERINDPLKHMIRNALDHGIEVPEERERKGKDRMAHIRLNAYHQEGNIYIEVSDDGRGLDKMKIREKAVALGLMPQAEEASDDQLFSFLFRPGFTTSETAGDLSGRGVGMDVVKTNIGALRGSIEIQTVMNVGTTFRIKLPLTLAIIDGMLVRSGTNVYIIPLLSIIECIRPKKEDVETVAGKGELIHVRGEYVPLIRLYDFFGIAADIENPWESLVVIVESGTNMVGIMVDELIGQQQIVIKNLGGRISETRAVSGAAILGDGKVALILDIHGFVGEMMKITRSGVA